VAVDDLTAPLGQEQTKKRRFALSVGIPQILLGALSLSVVTFAAWAVINDDPFGGEPIAKIATDLPVGSGGEKSEGPKGKSDPTRPNRYDGPTAESEQPALPPGTQMVTIIDGSSGKREQVVIPIAPDEQNATSDVRVIEPSRYGPLPKVAKDGARPADIFAQPAKAIPGKPDAPRIAIVVSGLGVGSAATAEALKKLPGAVTLAFMPYSADLNGQVSRARSSGHEVLLQVPMEPLDYPDNDPGPQTLLTSLDIPQNIDRLHALMARTQGYVGLTSFMGERFSATEAVLAPVLREIAKRGLIYFDDGSSSRSVASQLAGAHNLSFVKSDITIDAVPTPSEIDSALGRLESIARGRGTAVGTVSALPVSIGRIAKWIQAAEGRGFVLVPISATIAKAKST
jgi:polysaccharide deacetylase 2 family uncharacterized protein YibQ